MDYEKLSPALALVVDDFEDGGARALVPHRDTLGLVSLDDELPKPARVVMFLHVDEGTPADAFADLGVELNQPDGPVRTGIVPLDALDALTEREQVHRIVSAHTLDALMDVAAPFVGIPALQAQGFTGQGVVIGIVDSGIESTHPSFEGRLLRVWDQTLPGPGVLEGNYGAEFTGEMMQVSQDTVGHGTHVAGVAAGNDATFPGVAPGADIVIVKSTLLTPHIADGIRYCFRVAQEMNRPAVVNLSLGGHDDAHDGTDSLSMVIDAAVGPGRIVCTAAGNDGNLNVHAQVNVREGRVRTINANVVVPRQEGEQPVATFTGWYGGDDRMEVAVVSPSGQQTPYQAVITPGSPRRTHQLADGAVRVVTPGPNPSNGDLNFVVQILPRVPLPNVQNPQAWRIRVRGVQVVDDGIVDVWTVNVGTGQFTGGTAKDSMKVGAPGAASGAVTVAAFTTRGEWQDIFGDPHESGEVKETISSFSSEGPRRDGVRKPDVAAPGSMIVAALSSKSPVRPTFLVDALNRAMQGTSMASPFIAGTVALLLEDDPTLDPDQVKEALRDNSRIPDQPAGTWDPKWGYGLIDAKGL